MRSPFHGRQGGILVHMASILAILSSILWGTSDFEGGRLSKKHAPLAVLGFSQVLGLVFGLVVMLAFGAWDAQALGSGDI